MRPDLTVHKYTKLSYRCGGIFPFLEPKYVHSGIRDRIIDRDYVSCSAKGWWWDCTESGLLLEIRSV